MDAKYTAAQFRLDSVAIKRKFREALASEITNSEVVIYFILRDVTSIIPETHFRRHERLGTLSGSVWRQGISRV